MESEKKEEQPKNENPEPVLAAPKPETEQDKSDKNEEKALKEKIEDNNNILLLLDGGKIVDENYDRNKVLFDENDDQLSRKIPLYYDEDKYVQVIKKKEAEKGKGDESSESESDDEDDFPGMIIGNVKKKSNRLGFTNTRFLEINSQKGTFKRYKNTKDYPKTPNEAISLKSINSVKRIPKEEDKDYFELELTFTKGEKSGDPKKDEKKVISYMITHEECRNKWNECLSILCRWAVKGEPMPHVNKRKVLFIDDETGIVQEFIKRKKKVDPLEANKVSLKKFKIFEEIDRDEFGTTFRVVQKKTEQVFAMKVMNKEYLIKQRYLHCTINELDIMQVLNGFPFCTDVHYAWQSPNYLYIVTDYCEGGDFTNIKTINNIKLFFAEVLCAIEYFQCKNIIYRDLRPSNILLDEEGHIKINNFYFSKKIQEAETKKRAFSFCGTPRYFSPELVNEEGVDVKCNIYALGLLLFELTTGVPAFRASNMTELIEKIKNNQINYGEAEIYGEVKEFLETILVKNPEERLSVEDLKNHPYFKDINFVKVMLKSYGPIKVEKKGAAKEKEDDDEKEKEEQTPKETKETTQSKNLSPKMTFNDFKDDKKEFMRYVVKDFYFVKKEHLKDLVVKKKHPPITNKEILEKIK